MGLTSVAAGLLLLLLAAPVAAEVTPSGFEIVIVALMPNGDGAIAEPSSGPSANPQGDVLYAATDAGRDAVYLRYANGMRLRLLGAGDPLAGSKVSHVVTMPNSLDGFRQSLVYTALEDGRVGLVRLVPPASAFAVNPKSGDRSEPISFHIMGDGFSPGVEVAFGDTKAGFVTVLSRTELAGVIPAGAPAGVVDVSVSRPGAGKHVLKGAFEFRDAPASGCQGVFPDHRPPQTSMSLGPWVAAAGLVGLRRRRLRRSER